MNRNLVNLTLITAMILSLFGPFKGVSEASPSPGNDPLAGLDSRLEYSPVFLKDLNPGISAVNTIEKPEPNIYPELLNTVGIQFIQFDVFVTATFTDADGITVKYDSGIAEANDASTSGASDPADNPDPPDPPSNPFMDVQFNTGANALQWDSRPLFGTPASATWDLRVKVSSDTLGSANAGPPAVVTLTWSKGALPASYGFVIDDTLNGGPIVNLRASPFYVYSTYIINSFRALKLTAWQNRSPSVTVLFPNGGEIVSGIASVIAMASDPDSSSPFFDAVTTVTFDYSANSGSTWVSIGFGALTSGTSASGVWSVPWNTSGLSEVSTYRIRATAFDKSGASATDSSDANFSVYQILWSIMLNGSQTLPLTAGGFQGFGDNPITANTPIASAGFDSLDIPNPPAPPSDQYFDIWFATTGGNTQRDARPFLDPTIWPLRVKNQVGLSPGSSLVTITAAYTNVPPNLTFVTITDPSTGISQNLRVSPVYTYMQSYDTTKSLNFTVKSDSPPTASVTFPNGGEIMGGSINVSAAITDPDLIYGDIITTVTFSYSTSPYFIWTLIGTGSQTSTGVWSATWNTSTLSEGSGYKIKVIAQDSSGATSEDISDNSFTIKQILWKATVTGAIDPSYSDTFAFGQASAAFNGIDSYDITDITPATSPYLDLYSLVDATRLSQNIKPASSPIIYSFQIQSNGLSGSANLTWNIASVPLTYSFIVLQDASSGYLTDMKASPSYSYSSGLGEIRNFNIYLKNNNPPTATVTYPNGGETFGGIATIAAIASDPDYIAPYNDVISINFYYSTSPWATAAWQIIGPGSLTGSSTWIAYWNTFALPERSDYKLKAVVQDSRGITVEDLSNGSFTLKQILWKGAITATIADIYSDTFAFGQASLAFDIADNYDIPNPSTITPPYLDLYSLINGSKYSQDIHPISSAAFYSFRVQTEGLSGNTSLTWNIASVPLTYSFIVLQDASSGYLTDMKASPGYSYSSGLGEIRNFNIYLKNNNPPTATVTYPNGGEIVGGPASVSAIISDQEGIAPYNDTITSMNFYYATGAFTTASWTLIGPGTLASGSYASGLWNTPWNTLALVEGSGYWIKAVASDSKGATTEDISNSSFNVSTILWGVNIQGNLSTYSDSIISGIAPWANTVSDSYDILNPPIPPAPPYLDMFFLIDGQRYTRDARPHIDPTTWNFKVNASGISGLTTISKSLTARATGKDHIVLQDLSNGTTRNLSITPTYTYNASLDETRNFSLTIKTNQPPSVQIIYPNGGEIVGGIVNVSALVSDSDAIAPYNDFISGVTFQYSTNGLTWSNIGAGVKTGTSTWSASWNTTLIPKISNYRIRATAMDSQGLSSIDSSDGTFSIVDKFILIKNFSVGWNMWSYPFYPDPNTNSGQLSDDIATGLYVFHYNPSSGMYDLTDNATAGWGYWLKINAPVSIDAEGFPVSIAEYEIPLANGWNQIGQPFNNNINWSGAKVKKDGVTRTITQSHSDGLVFQWLYSFDPASSQYITRGASDGVLQPFTGYWIKSNVDGAILVIPSQ